MPKISTRVTFDKKAAAMRIRAVAGDALTEMGRQAEKDVRKYVPKDQGALRDSGITHSDDKAHDLKFNLRWEEPYAQYLWHGKVMHGDPETRSLDDYGPEKITFTSMLAQAEWAKYAREVHGDNWKKIYQAALKKGLRT